MVVLPELSRPRIRILISFLPTSRPNSFENTKPMIIGCLNFDDEEQRFPLQRYTHLHVDKFKEQVDPQATAKTSKLTQQQQSDALRNQRQSSINKS